MEVGSVAFAVADGGLKAKFWGLSIILGAGSLPVQQVINVVYAAGISFKGKRNQKRLKKNRNITTQEVNGGLTSINNNAETE